METLFRKVFCNAIGQNKEHRNPTRHDYYATNVGTMRWTDHFGKDAWLDDGDEVSVQWWLETIVANRERAIETLRITIETYTQLRNPESNNLAAIFYDALINEGLGKSVNEEIEKRVKDLEELCRFASIPELIIKNPTFIKADKSPLTEKEREWAEKSIADYEKKLQKFNVKNEPMEGVYDLSWDEELYNAFCEAYHDDGSNDSSLQNRLKSLLLKFLEANNAKSLSSSIVSEEEINSAAFEHEKDTENSFRNEESFRCGALWYRDKSASSIVYPSAEEVTEICEIGAAKFSTRHEDAYRLIEKIKQINNQK